MADQKLLDKYSRGTTTIFDWYVFHCPANTPNHISQVDLSAADALMNANISAQNARWQQMSRAVNRRATLALLGKIPSVANIENATFDADVSKLIRSIMGPGIKLAIATKILSIKRPFLIPMMDRVVQDCFASKDPEALMSRFRQAVSSPGNRRVLSSLAKLVRREFGILPSPLRILEQLIWFDWNLVPGKNGLFEVRGFREWSYNARRPSAGVVKRA
jgi:hypothetical protein